MTHDPARDFDFEIGQWTVAHRRLKQRLCGCEDWDSFTGTADVRALLGGAGNIEDNVLDMPSGSYRAIALRSYDAASQTWAIWWLDGRSPHNLDVPVKGRFADGVGQFFADDTHDGRAVRLRFTWAQNPDGLPRWEQALSPDQGATWETNWTMDFTRR